MSKYIDKDAFVKSIKPIASKMSFGIQSDIANAIVSAPSIDIVRCKECILFADRRDDSWWDSDSDGYCRRTSRLGDHTEVDIDDFCSYGEREGE